jgi:hypothetical protein
MLIEEVTESLKKVPISQFPDAGLSPVNLKTVKLPICRCIITSSKKGE